MAVRAFTIRTITMSAAGLMMTAIMMFAMAACDIGTPIGDGDGDGDDTTGGKVAAPVFSPDPSLDFNAPVQVEILCDTDNAQIFYTTDNSVPGEGSTFYSGSFIISVSTTVKAIATKDGMEDSDIATAVYSISPPGNEPPVAEINQEDFIMQQYTTATLSVTASDPDDDNLTYQWSLNGSPVTGSDSLSYDFTPQQTGDYTIQVEVSDGYVSVSDSVSVTVIAPVDTESQIDLSLYRRLLIVDYFTEIAFENDQERYFFFEAAQAGEYLFSCSHAGEGDGIDTVDVAYTVCEEDGVTPLAGLQNVSSSYVSPIVYSMDAGVYFITFTAASSSAETGSIKMKIAVEQNASPVTVDYYRRLLIADDFSTVQFNEEPEKWYMLSVEQPATYWFLWDDAADGAGGSSVDIQSTLFTSDAETVHGGFSQIDNGYSAPLSVSLDAGTYFLKLSTTSGEAETGICKIMLTDSEPDNVIGVDFIKRLLIVDAFSTVEFAAEQEKWLVVSPVESSAYALVWSDSGEGDGTATMDILTTLYTQDKTTVMSGIDGLDNGYLDPPRVFLDPGDYYICIETTNGVPQSGAVKIKIIREE